MNSRQLQNPEKVKSFRIDNHRSLSKAEAKPLECGGLTPPLNIKITKIASCKSGVKPPHSKASFGRNRNIPDVGL
jgi:hypothetical protein